MLLQSVLMFRVMWTGVSMCLLQETPAKLGAGYWQQTSLLCGYIHGGNLLAKVPFSLLMLN